MHNDVTHAGYRLRPIAFHTGGHEKVPNPGVGAIVRLADGTAHEIEEEAWITRCPCPREHCRGGRRAHKLRPLGT